MNRNKVNPRPAERMHGYRIAGGDDIDHLPSRLLERTGRYPGTKPSPDDADPQLPGAGSRLSLALIHGRPQWDRKRCVSTSMLHSGRQRHSNAPVTFGTGQQGHRSTV